MGLKIRKCVCFLLTGALALSAGCVRIPLDGRSFYQVRAINPRSPTPAWDRTRYQLQSTSPSYITVSQGDTVYSLSRQHNVPTRDLIQANRLSAPFLLRKGQRLKLPPSSVHVVSKGDTVYSISRRYNVDMSQLARLNSLKEPYNIYPNQFLKLPGSIVASEEKPVAARRSPDKKSRAPAIASSQKTPQAGAKTQSAKQASSKATTQAKKSSVRLPKPPSRAEKNFAWPVQGKVMTKFGSAGAGRHNDGINIKISEGVKISAAENGVVAYAGNELKGFGNLLLLKHDDGWMTAYAHNQKILVKRGQTVKRGEAVALGGNTGSAKEPQLHFEIRKGTKAVNPLMYLKN